jgi:hypothetical protein
MKKKMTQDQRLDYLVEKFKNRFLFNMKILKTPKDTEGKTTHSSVAYEYPYAAKDGRCGY